MIKSGQVWKNGRAVVNLQRSEDQKLLAATFTIKNGGALQFSHANTFDEREALDYVLSMGCVLTDKILTTEVCEMAGSEGFEPPTFGFGDRRSTN